MNITNFSQLLPTELNTNIFGLLQDIDNYNTTDFWKFRYSKFVLSYIDKGYRLISETNMPCEMCYNNGFIKKNDICTNCRLDTPCVNCYWYNGFDNYCYCNGTYIHVSWNQIKPFIKNGYKYARYYDFINGKEWQNMLSEQKQRQIFYN